MYVKHDDHKHTLLYMYCVRIFDLRFISENSASGRIQLSFNDIKKFC
jgi:hypothetical protein